MHRAERCGNAAFGCMGPAQPLRFTDAPRRPLRLCASRHGKDSPRQIRQRGRTPQGRGKVAPRRWGMWLPFNSVPTSSRGLRQPPNRGPHLGQRVTATPESGSPPHPEGCGNPPLASACQLGGYGNPRIGVHTPSRGLQQPRNRGPHLIQRGCSNPEIGVPTSSRGLQQPRNRGLHLIQRVAATPTLASARRVGVAATPGACRCGPGWLLRPRGLRRRALHRGRRGGGRAHAPESGVTAALRPIHWCRVIQVKARVHGAERAGGYARVGFGRAGFEPAGHLLRISYRHLISIPS